MSRLADHDGLTEEQVELVKLVREFVDEQIIPVAQELEHEDEYPTDIVEGMKEMGIFGLMIPEEYGGLGESLLTYALVRRGDRPRLDVGQRHHQHPLHRRLHAAAARHGGAEAALPAADGDGRGPRRLLDERAGPGLRRLRDQDQGRARRRHRRLVRHRPEDVAHQRRQRESRCGAGEDGPRRRLGLQEHDDLPHREGAGLRRDRAGRHHPREDREDGLQGRRHDRDGPRGPPDHQRPDPRWRAGHAASTR